MSLPNSDWPYPCRLDIQQTLRAFENFVGNASPMTSSM